MERSDIVTVNCTFKCEASDVVLLEEELRNVCEVVSFKHLPNTTELYATDEVFKKLVDNKKKADEMHRTYLNSLEQEF